MHFDIDTVGERDRRSTPLHDKGFQCGDRVEISRDVAEDDTSLRPVAGNAHDGRALTWTKLAAWIEVDRGAVTASRLAILSLPPPVVANDDAAKVRCAKYLDTVNQGVATYHRDLSEREHKHLEECVAAGVLADRHYSEVEQHRAAALADQCQENAR